MSLKSFHRPCNQFNDYNTKVNALFSANAMKSANSSPNDSYPWLESKDPHRCLTDEQILERS